MRNRYIFLIFILLMLFLVTACSGQINTATNSNIKESEMPEPYLKALDDIKIGDYDSALKYLDLSIKDFPESKYVDNTYYLKCLIYCGKLSADTSILKNMTSGFEKGMILYSSDEKTIFKEYITDMKNEYNFMKIPLKEGIEYSLARLQKNNLVFDDLTVEQYNLNYLDVFENYSNIGYPMITKNDFYSNRDGLQKEMINFIIMDNAKEKIDLPSYYNTLLLASIGLGYEKDIQIKLSSKVMELTENDKYSKIRLETEDIIKKYNLNPN